MAASYRPTRSRTAIALAAAGLFVVGCGGPEPEANDLPAADIEPVASIEVEGIHVCNLYSVAEAEGVLDREVQEPDVAPINPVSSSSECQYESVAGDRVLTVQLEHLVNPEARAAQHRELFTEAQVIEGLGDQALYSASQLLVIAGEYQVVISVGGFMGGAAAQRVPVATAVAETVLSRL